MMEITMETRKVNTKNLLKFILCSGFGVLMFLVPIPQGDSFTTLLDFLKSGLKGLFGESLSYIVVGTLVLSAVVSIVDMIAKPDIIRNNHYLKKAFSTTPFYLASKIVGAVIACMVVFGVGPEMIISADTGTSIIDLCGTLFCIVISFRLHPAISD
ncbi:MAG: hypothetical protein ACLR71_20745 [[Clostridium] scindens]